MSSVFNRQIIFIIIIVAATSCMVDKGSIKVSSLNMKNTVKTKTLGANVSNVQVINNQIVITGNNLSDVTSLIVKDGGVTTSFQIESKTANSIVANSLTNITLAAGKILDLILSNASAASTFSINFSLCNSTLNGHGFDCSTVANDKDVLSFDFASGTWKPRPVNGLSYQGAWDALNDPQPAGAASGEYYIVSVANSPYNVGDWIVFNGATYDRIDNSQMITNVFGRTGAVLPLEGDYNLNKLADVDLTTAPTTNQVLKYDGTKWIAGTIVTAETDPSVTAFAKAALPTCNAGEVLKGNGTTLTCVTDNAGTTFTGTANRAVVTDGAGALAVSAITDTVLGYLSGATSNIQTQIDSKLASASFVNWQIAGAQTLEPTRLNLTTANRVVITNGTSTPIASTVTTTELGYLSGVTSAIQTQLNAKLSSYTETDPGVTAFAKAALPTCNAGEVLKANGTSLSCVTDVTGAGAFTGAIDRVVLTDGTTGALTVSAVTNTEVGYVAGVTSAIQTQLNAKQASITSATALVTGSVQTNLQGGLQVNPYNTAAGNTGEARFYELAAGGTNYTGFKAPDALASNLIYVLPVTAPTAGQVLSSDATGILSWIAIPSAPVSTVFGRTGAVAATAGDYTATQITNTAAGNIAATTAQAAINELDTEKQSIASFAADVRAVVLTGVSFATNSAIVAGDTILEAFGKLQAQITGQATTIGTHTTSLAAKADMTNVSQIITAAGVTGLTAPVAGSDATNKTYVDGIWAPGTAGNVGDIYRSTGKVGVGTATPVTKLDVNGAIRVGVDATACSATIAGAMRFNTPNVEYCNGTSWAAFTAGAAPVSSIYGRTGAVVAASGDYTATQITNTAAGNIAAVTAQAAINELDTEKQNISSLAADVRAIVLTGISFATNSAIVAGDSILAAFGKLQAQITGQATTIGTHTTSLAAKADTTNVSQIITAAGVTGLTAPVAGSDATNKTYVDGIWAPGTGGNVGDIFRASGKVGVGTATPASKLQVSGAITNTVSTFSAAFTCGTSVIDFSTSNFQNLSPSNTIAAGSCSVGLSNLVAGGSYTLVMTGTGSTTNAITYNFTGYTFKYLPTNFATIAGKDTIYTFLYNGITVYVTWAGGY